jgi:hypothetical protein
MRFWWGDGRSSIREMVDLVWGGRRCEFLGGGSEEKVWGWGTNESDLGRGVVGEGGVDCRGGFGDEIVG